MDTWLQYLIIAIVLILVLLIVIKLTRRDFRIEANKLITYLGGKDNIVSAEANMSRFKVILKDVSIVNKEAIEKRLKNKDLGKGERNFLENIKNNL